MPYATTTRTAAIDALAARLADPPFVRWSSLELQGYLVEALRVWQALTAGMRDTAVVPLTPGVAFYDLTTTIPALRGFSVLDTDLITEIEYHLLEPPTPLLWTGSEQFTLDDLVAALQRRRDQFLRETGMLITPLTLPVIGPPPDGRVPLDERIITLRRAAWIATDGSITPLLRDDEWAFTHYQIDWVQHPTRPPKAYSLGVTPPLLLQLAPPPLDTGTLDLLVVQRGAVLTPTISTLLGVPDDWAWVVKYGALADLLHREGLAYDPLRATYCEARWRQGVALAQRTPSVLAARLTNVTARVGSVVEADTYRRTWQTTPGTPTLPLLMGYNLLGLCPPPDAAPHSLTVEVVRNMILPALPGDFLQVGPEVLDSLLDYAQHLALFKEGPDQLQVSQALFDRFLTAAGVTIPLYQATSPNRRALTEQRQQDERALPRTLPPAEAGAVA
jgi:hypothetical protein